MNMDDEDQTVFLGASTVGCEEVADKPAAVLALDGIVSGQLFDLAPGEVAVGRSPENAIALDSKQVSRRHLRFAITAQHEVTVEDLGSSNGTYINNRRIEGPTRLTKGDVLRVGDVVFKFIPQGDAERLQYEALQAAHHDVFISYAHHDKQAADAVCHSLEADKIRCWIAPRDILPSVDWGEAIIDALNHVKVMVLVFSSRSNASPQVKREIERAVNKGVAILPFRIENVMPNKTFEYFLSTQHWLDALSGPLEEHLAGLNEAVKVLIKRKLAGDPDII